MEYVWLMIKLVALVLFLRGIICFANWAVMDVSVLDKILNYRN